MGKWFLVTFLGVALILSILVAQLVAVVVCSEGDPTLILCSLLIGNSVTTTLLVYWCNYTTGVLRENYWRKLAAGEKPRRDRDA